MAQAQEAPPGSSPSAAERIAALEARIRLLEDRLEALESRTAADSAPLVASNGVVPLPNLQRQTAETATVVPALVASVAAPAAPPAQAVVPQPAAPTIGAGPDGFTIQAPSGDFRLNIHYSMNVDGRFATAPASSEPNSFSLRRAQPSFDGTLYKHFGFRMSTDFGQGKVRALDAYVDVRPWPELGLRVGRLKVPVGLERLSSGSTLPLVERAFPTQLTPNRDLGLQLYGDLAGGRLSYAVGVFNGVIDNANGDGDTDDHKEFAGRVFALPFHGSGLKALQGLGLGVGGSYGEADSTRSALYTTAGQRTIFAATLNDHGIRHRIAPQGYYYYGPFGLLSEYIRSSQEVQQGSSGVTLTNAAWQVETSYVLTGEHASYSGVTPARSFEPGSGTLGAFEVAARYSDLRIDSRTFSLLAGPGSNARGAKAWALGLNWYLNRSVRMMFNYEQTDFQRALNGPALDKEHLFLQRLQLRF